MHQQNYQSVRDATRSRTAYPVLKWGYSEVRDGRRPIGACAILLMHAGLRDSFLSVPSKRHLVL